MPIYNLLERSSHDFDMTRRLWFYSKDGTTNFHADIPNTDAFKSFGYKTTIIGRHSCTTNSIAS